MEKATVFDGVERRRDRLTEIAQELWNRPELSLQEERSAALLSDVLEEAGFDVERGVGGLPTAFEATYGDGDPTVGILAEYDALPDLSQEVSAEREPIEEGAPGHGCGHNLFGTACLGAALALADAIDDGELDGTVVYYGCPAEELLVGKVYMARDGAFDDLDAALTWHPGTVTSPTLSSSAALDSVEFTFEGTSAHAAVSPEAGRSALDGVQLLNTGVEYVREHVPDEANIHYVITEGGRAPNVVPERASVWYYVRSPRREQVEEITDWLVDVADAAAAMSQTSVTENYYTGCYDSLRLESMGNAIWETMQAIGPIEYTDEDRAFAGDLQATVSEADVESTITRVPEEYHDDMRGEPLYGEPVEPHGHGVDRAGSTDVGDVSWIAPTGSFRAATWPLGTNAHTWQAVAANGSFGAKGMVFAAKVIAGTAWDLLSDGDLLDRVTEEFDHARDGASYESPLPPDAEPPFDVLEG